MSSLFRIKVEEKVEKTVIFKIFIIHPDISNFPDTESFALNILLDYWHKAKNGYFSKNENLLPIDNEELKKHANNTKDEEILEQYHNITKGETIYVSKKEYDAMMKSGCLTFRDKTIGGYGVEDDKYYVNFMPDFYSFEEIATQNVYFEDIKCFKNYPWKVLSETATEEEKEKFESSRFELENVPQANLIVKFDTKFSLDYLLQGVEWETSVYR